LAGQQFNRWFIRAGRSSAEAEELLSRMYQRNLPHGPCDPWDGGCAYGTDFRHAVEFSRSGRTPSQPFPAVPGQPTKHYSGQRRRVKPASARLPAWSPLAGSIDLGGASRLGDVRSGSLAGSALRTRRTLASRARRSQIPSADAQDARKRWAPAATAAQMILPVRGVDVCELGHPTRRQVPVSTSRATRRLPFATTRPAISARGRS
jgi:hypothetical protein